MMNKDMMPVIFFGHGSPLNAIDENSKARATWAEMSRILEKPRCIVAISAHWYTQGLYVRTADNNPKIDDMYGFPEALYRLRYAAPACPEEAAKVLRLLEPAGRAGNDWGLDHGVWSVLANVYPQADVPVVMVSVDGSADSSAQFEVGRRLAPLRREGVLIMGSGNVVHNLMMTDWDMTGGYTWAETFNDQIKQAVLQHDYTAVINYKKLDQQHLAVPTPDHFNPLLTVLGALDGNENVTVFNDYCELGSMAMTSYLFGVI